MSYGGFLGSPGGGHLGATTGAISQRVEVGAHVVPPPRGLRSPWGRQKGLPNKRIRTLWPLAPSPRPGQQEGVGRWYPPARRVRRSPVRPPASHR
eukprot:8479159-Pyramimonas_sp.AAC.1